MDIPLAAPATLTYFRHDREAPRRPVLMVVLAAIGMIVCLATLIGQWIAPVLSNTNMVPSWAVYPTQDPYGVLWGFSALIRNLLVILVLVGCCGILSLRRGAMWLMVVGSYGWLMFGVLDLFMLMSPRVWSKLSILRRFGDESQALALTALAGIAYPLFALIVLRRQKAVEFFNEVRTWRAEMPWPRMSAPAWLTFVVALVWLVGNGLQMFNLSSIQGNVGGGYRMEGFPVPRDWQFMQIRNTTKGMALGSGCLICAIQTVLAVGCLRCARGAGGRWMIVGYCLAALAIASVVPLRSDFERMIYYMSGSAMASGTSHLGSALLERGALVFPPALLLAIFTWRPASDQLQGDRA